MNIKVRGIAAPGVLGVPACLSTGHYFRLLLFWSGYLTPTAYSNLLCFAGHFQNPLLCFPRKLYLKRSTLYCSTYRLHKGYVIRLFSSYISDVWLDYLLRQCKLCNAVTHQPIAVPSRRFDHSTGSRKREVYPRRNFARDVSY